MMPATRDSTPGRSGSSARSRTSRPPRTSPRISTRRQEPRIDVAAGQDDPDTAAAEALGLGDQRRQTGGSGPLDDELLPLDHQLDGGLQLPFGDETNRADQRGDDPARQLPRAP